MDRMPKLKKYMYMYYAKQHRLTILHMPCIWKVKVILKRSEELTFFKEVRSFLYANSV